MLVILRHVSASNSRVPSNLDPPSKGTVMRQSGFKSITAKMPFFLSLFLGAQDFRLLILLSYTSVCRSVCDFGKAYSTMVMQTFKMHPCKDLYFSRSPFAARRKQGFPFNEGFLQGSCSVLGAFTGTATRQQMHCFEQLPGRSSLQETEIANDS